MWLVAQEVECVADPDLVPLAGDVEGQGALEREDEFLARVDERLVATVCAGVDRGKRRCTAEGSIGTGHAGQGQTCVWGVHGRAVGGWCERNRVGTSILLDEVGHRAVKSRCDL